jgi:hypothetical protein
MITHVYRESRRTAVNHRPIAIGMVLCEQVIVEEGTHNITPVNCFNVREVTELPGTTTFFALAWLANGMGKLAAELVVERLDNLEETYRVNRSLEFPDRLRDMRFSARIRDCHIPIAGAYQVSLVIDGETIASRKFHIRKRAAKP